ncbi:hypothetical protein ACFQ2B_29640 [Streptomyces stramineus]
MELREARALKKPMKDSLRGLWLGATPTLTTVRPAASPVQRTFQYGRKQLIDTLVAVFERYQPTVVRTLDPSPTHILKHQMPPGTPPVLQGMLTHDHQDHTTSAFFAQAALAEYWGRKHSRPTAVESYVGYEVDKATRNLDAATTAHKVTFLDTYGWADAKDCGDDAGCGDRKVGKRSRTSYANWSGNCRHRAPGTTRWVQPLPDGGSRPSPSSTARCSAGRRPPAAAPGRPPHRWAAACSKGRCRRCATRTARSSCSPSARCCRKRAGPTGARSSPRGRRAAGPAPRRSARGGPSARPRPNRHGPWRWATRSRSSTRTAPSTSSSATGTAGSACARRRRHRVVGLGGAAPAGPGLPPDARVEDGLDAALDARGRSTSSPPTRRPSTTGRPGRPAGR